ncbi:(2Fe-2S)-binding protein [Bacillus marasmi]|uniref:(2Fe-2S)-binding protein n=1 Tax=Bacillus marasmi TaxID=1926279 RepID=UPI0011C6F903|nr:(2Fe-2S)-binding protein [Bacillus marasmi]
MSELLSMHKLPVSIEKELAKYLVTLSNEKIPTVHIDTADDTLETLLHYAKNRIGNGRDRVAVSMLFRRYAFVITAQLFMLSKHRLAWQGDIQDISIIDDPDDKQWLPTFLFRKNDWLNVEEANVEEAFRTILYKFAASLLHPLATKTKTSKLVLWENIWAYTLWMYDGLLKESCIQTSVENDLSILLGDEVWIGIEKRSPFKKYLGEKTVPESVQSYKRVTCCFYYEIDGNDKCAYCPNASC